jgi:23S rRNA (guanosine2251-2'-O)-methyltransferase
LKPEHRPLLYPGKSRTRETAPAKGYAEGHFRIYGRQPVLEALRLGLARSVSCTRTAHGKIMDDIRRLAAEQELPLTVMDEFPEEEGVVTQGVQAVTLPPELRHDIQHFVEELPESPHPLLLMLDGITDPHNFGAILRSADAAGVKAVIIRERRQVHITDAVVKSSAGAAYTVAIFEVVNLSQTLRMLRDKGFWSVAAAQGEDSKPYREHDWNAKTVLIVGAEGAGISDLIKKEADVRVSIPMFGKLDSLNVSVAAGVLLFESAMARKIG